MESLQDVEEIEGKALRRMTEREKGADCHRGLTSRNQTTGDQIDDGDVVGINGMAESKGVCNDGGGGEVSFVNRESVAFALSKHEYVRMIAL